MCGKGQQRVKESALDARLERNPKSAKLFRINCAIEQKLRAISRLNAPVKARGSVKARAKSRIMTVQDGIIHHTDEVVIIKPSRGMVDLDLKGLWRFRDLFHAFAVRDIRLRYRQTALGAIWVVLQPLLSAVIFAVVFGFIAKMPSQGVPYFLIAFSGMMGWTLFQGNLTRVTPSLVANGAAGAEDLFSPPPGAAGRGAQRCAGFPGQRRGHDRASGDLWRHARMGPAAFPRLRADHSFPVAGNWPDRRAAWRSNIATSSISCPFSFSS